MQLQEFLNAVVGDANLLEADEDADAVIDVDDVVAHFQVAEVGEKRLRGRPPALRRTAFFFEDVVFRIDLDARVG